MDEFQLILLSEVDRTAIRKARHSGAFPLTQPRSPTGVGMVVGIDAEYEISAEDIATWYTPREAFAYAVKAVGRKSATNAIWQRLVAGLIEAAAANFSSAQRNQSPHPYTKPSLIPARYWKKYSKTGSDFWAGDVRFFIAGSRPEFSRTYHYFGIRLNPDQVRSSLPAPPSEVPEPTEPERRTETAEIEDPEPQQKGPPVSPDHLKAWFDLYQRTYAGAADTEANALQYF